MKSQVKVTFFPLTARRKKDGTTPIYVRIAYNGERFSQSTGLSIQRKDWNIKTKKVKLNTELGQSVNESLDLLESNILSIANILKAKGNLLSVESIKEQLNMPPDEETTSTVFNCFNDYTEHIQKLINKDYSKSTYFKYRITMERTMQFIRMHYKKSDVDVQDLNDKFLMDFETFLRLNIGNSPKTIHKHFQRLKTVLSYAWKRGVINQPPSLHYKVKVPIKKVEYLTQEEIDRIENKDFKVERLNIIRDLFIFSCYSGLSYTEMQNLHSSHIRVIDSQVWIDMVRQKTKRPLTIPLLPKCVELIEKYKTHKVRTKKGLLLPVPTNQVFNAYLKQINDLCEITTPLTCHLGRRSFACTILLRNKVHIHVVSQLLGHSNTNITVKSYLGTVPELMISQFDMVKDIYNKE